MAFKQLYRVFREEDALVDQFVLEISHIILFSMRLAANDNESLGTAQLCAQVLEAMGRVYVFLSCVFKIFLFANRVPVLQNCTLQGSFA
jgi:hypothetical protein